MIDVYFSSDGKHTVHVAANSAQELNELVPAAKTLYEGIIKSYGTKAQMWEAMMKANASLPPIRGSGTGVPEPAVVDAPLCPVHKEPMHMREGKFGGFWSCSHKQPNGKWCTVTKQIGRGQEMPVKVVEQ